MVIDSRRQPQIPLTSNQPLGKHLQLKVLIDACHSSQFLEVELTRSPVLSGRCQVPVSSVMVRLVLNIKVQNGGFDQCILPHNDDCPGGIVETPGVRKACPIGFNP